MTITPILSRAWLIYRKNFAVIFGIALTIWIPVSLACSYVDSFIFGGEQSLRSTAFQQCMDNCFGVVANAAMVVVTAGALEATRVSYGTAIKAGLAAWGRMFWTRFLFSSSVLIGLLLLIVPGVYLGVRLALVEAVTVHERICGVAAMRRSFELTRGRAGWLFKVGAALSVIVVLAIVVIVTPAMLIPESEHWLVQALTTFACEVAIGYGVVVLAVVYAELQKLSVHQSDPTTTART
jgi:hypothetical protein